MKIYQLKNAPLRSATVWIFSLFWFSFCFSFCSSFFDSQASWIAAALAPKGQLRRSGEVVNSLFLPHSVEGICLFLSLLFDDDLPPNCSTEAAVAARGGSNFISNHPSGGFVLWL